MYDDGKGKKKEKSYVAVELAQGGELFDFITNYGHLDEGTARYFFH